MTPTHTELAEKLWDEGVEYAIYIKGSPYTNEVKSTIEHKEEKSQ